MELCPGSDDPKGHATVCADSTSESSRWNRGQTHVERHGTEYIGLKMTVKDSC